MTAFYQHPCNKPQTRLKHRLEMPRGDSRMSTMLGKGRSGYGIPPEQAAGIALLVIIFVIIMFVGCWYYKRRSGYSLIRTQSMCVSNGALHSLLSRWREERASLDHKVPLQEYSNMNPTVPNAPPAYEKIAVETLPPAYSP
ncbi:melanoma antigen recognized by T-cells 1 isoform X2 [Protopterus annectens]|uniref:melanoma antigen recognized by T-cells 1 isoform X2 n=1 Tax=Protopterus annectens TaxID=7888 RepID=UPI001CFBB0FD|nr:melanoma antigen recognized by T-cells 1 isoform X2 [Protopterus annectens]